MARGAQQTQSMMAPSGHGAEGQAGTSSRAEPLISARWLLGPSSPPRPSCSGCLLAKGASSTVCAGASQKHVSSQAAWGRPRQAPHSVLTLVPRLQKEAGGRAELSGAHPQLNLSKWAGIACLAP